MDEELMSMLNELTPEEEIKVLEYIKRLKEEEFSETSK